MAWMTIVSMVTLSLVVQSTMGKPLNKRGPPSPDPVEAGSKEDENMGTGLEYDRYLRQVVEILESDNEFRKKLETANITDIKSGAIAMHLELVNNTIRTKLDEIKRMEVQRLQELARIKMRSMSGVNRMDIPSHLDLRNPHSFEMKDLETLIKKTTNDLEAVDKKRRDEFKTYEMEKEYEYQEKLKHLPEEKKIQVEKHHKELLEKHNQHPKVNHPGSKHQMEEVWEKSDHLEDQDFDPKTFFKLHDLNGDGFWDIQEVEAVLQRELDKAYDNNNSPEEDDPVKRFEDMNRMREHVFTEIDVNKDLMITLDEFITFTGKQGENEKFNEDDGWDLVDDKSEYTDEELQEYIRQNHPQPGVVQPPIDSNLKYSPEEMVQQQHMQQQMDGQGMPHHQQGMPQQGMPQQGMHQQQGMPQQGMHHQQQGMPQQGMPQQGMQQQGMQQQRFQHQPNEVPQMQHQEQQQQQQQPDQQQEQQQQQQHFNQVNQGQPQGHGEPLGTKPPMA